MLSGRLGLDSARIPHIDRHGLVGLDRGRLEVENGCLRFSTPGGWLPEGDYQIPHQSISMIMLGPGSSVTHDALRVMAEHDVGLIAVGDGGVRIYTATPLTSGASALARRHAEVWARPQSRIAVARRMFAMCFGEVVRDQDLDSLRGKEGVRRKASYVRIAREYGIEWRGRHYNRQRPNATDIPNQAINHASTAVYAAAAIAVAATATIPQLGFIHEDAANAFVLDIADLFRDSVTLRIAFSVARDFTASGETVDRMVRSRANEMFATDDVIPAMIDHIKKLLDADE